MNLLDLQVKKSDLCVPDKYISFRFLHIKLLLTFLCFTHCITPEIIKIVNIGFDLFLCNFTLYTTYVYPNMLFALTGFFFGNIFVPLIWYCVGNFFKSDLLYILKKF